MKETKKRTLEYVGILSFLVLLVCFVEPLCVNTGAEVTICHMLGKCKENSVSYLKFF